MRELRILLVLALINAVFTTVKAQATPSKTGIPKENFFAFIVDFSTSRDFQVSRIKFPFADCYYNDTGTMAFVCDSLLANVWEPLSFVDTSSGMVLVKTFYDSFEAAESDSDERVYAIFKPESDFAIHYYFKNMDGRWFLVKRRNYSY